MKIRNKTSLAVILICHLLLPAAVLAQRSSQCQPFPTAPCPTGPKDPSVPYCSYYDRFPYGFAYYKNDLNPDLNDYGSLLQDMGRGTDCCLETVQRLLYQKVQDELQTGAFGPAQWLRGGDIFFLASTALQLGARGALPLDLHNLILQALGQYVAANTPVPYKNCAHPPTPRDNTCMEDYAVAAEALAWAAAYYHLNNLPAQASNAASYAEQYIRDSFNLSDAICLRDVMDPCNQCEPANAYDGMTAQLALKIAGDQIEVLTYNRAVDNPSYGMGNLILLSGAVEGLRFANRGYTATQVEAVLAQGLVRHGQKRVSDPAGGVCQPWGNGCYTFVGCNPVTCADLGYTPGMFPVKDFLEDKYKYQGTLGLIKPSTPATPQYQFDGFCGDRFTVCDPFFGDGRLSGYRDMGWRWPYEGARPQMAGAQQTPPDLTVPMLDVDVPAHQQVIGGRTWFFGWAIDRETAIVSVSFTVDGQPVCLEEYNYGGGRQDVCDFFGLQKCPYCPSGWAGFFDPAALAEGPHVLRVTAKDVSGKTATYDRQFVVDRP